jgi:predicted aldo/keto reductase-like oxidoreductase
MIHEYKMKYNVATEIVEDYFRFADNTKMKIQEIDRKIKKMKDYVDYDEINKLNNEKWKLELELEGLNRILESIKQD